MTHFEHNQDQRQFELTRGDQTAFVEYFTEGDKYYLTHTEVPEALRGQGMAAELIEKTLQHLVAQNASVVPQCAYVLHFINAHPKWHGILPEGYQM